VANERFIAQLYHDLLGREADVDGLTDWGTFLAAGGTRTQLVTAFENSPEYRGDEVADLYQQFLRRSASPQELTAWVNLMNGGVTLEQVQNRIAGSQEFFQVQGGATNAGFLNALYADALGRVIDPSGASAWSQALANGATPLAVATDILRSAEADGDFVEAVYGQFLQRPADAAGLAYWTNSLLQGAGESAILASILSSDEYFSKP
jgi:hypothetical protein